MRRKAQEGIIKKERGRKKLSSGELVHNGYKHGLAYHPLNHRWYSIKDKCYNEKCSQYYKYGALGVRMCDEWLNDFKAFYDWCMANGWEQGLQIDKDIKARAVGQVPGLLYSPEFCSFVTRKENCNSKRNNRFIEYNGETKTVSQWADITGIKATRIYARVFKLRWSVKDAFEVPIFSRLNKGTRRKNVTKKVGRLIEFNGEKRNIQDWGKEVGIGRGTIWFRLKKGWSIEEVLTLKTSPIQRNKRTQNV